MSVFFAPNSLLWTPEQFEVHLLSVLELRPSEIETILENSQRFVLGPDCFEFVAEAKQSPDLVNEFARTNL